MYKVTISNNNIKLGGIPSISFPPVITCENCAECSKKCYALRMEKRYKNVAESWQNNLQAWKETPESVIYAIMQAAAVSSYFRYFVGGDIPNEKFFLAMIKIARKIKTCKFLAFTKKYNIVNDYLNGGGKLPKNLIIIFSGWGKVKQFENPYNLPESNVIFRHEQPPEKALICGGNCCKCICAGVGCWQLKRGETIYFHEH